MKILFYNIGYGRGHTGSILSYLKRVDRFFYTSNRAQRKVLDQCVALIDEVAPDVVAVAEILSGSFRNQQLNQQAYLKANVIQTVLASAIDSKYSVAALGKLPFHFGNGNSVLSFVPAIITPLFMRVGRKKLVFKVETKRVTMFSVHLPLVASHRQAQLLELVRHVNDCQGDVVVCGDFNIFGGVRELDEFLAATNLALAGAGEATYPSTSPRQQFDLFLYLFKNSQGRPTVTVLPTQASDHLPVLLEWES